MKIAVIGAKGLPPKQGGIEHHCAELYPRMVAQGHSVDLFARSSYNEMPWYEPYDYEGVRVIPLPCPGRRGLDAFASAALGAIAGRGDRYDILHFHALGPALFTALARSLAPAKIVVTCHGLDWQRDKWGKLSSRLIRLGEQSAVRFADRLIVVSQDLQSYFLKTYGRETVYLRNAPARYAASDPTFATIQGMGLQPGRYLLFLGRLVPEKCPDLLIQAFQRLQPAGWKLVIAGGNSDTSPFTEHLLTLASGNPNILFTSELHGSRLAEVVRGAGLFVLPSNLEGLPLVLLEAMREGIPVLTSDIPVHREIVGSDRGVLFRTGSLESCIHQLQRTLDRPEERGERARRAQQFIRTNYHWDDITAACLALYQGLLPSLQTASPDTTRVPVSAPASQAER